MTERFDSDAEKRSHLLGPLLGAALSGALIVGLSAMGIVWLLFGSSESDSIGAEAVAMFGVLGGVLGIVAGAVAAGGDSGDGHG